MATVAGLSDHMGWVETVTLSVRDGAPVILDRRRLELIEPGLPEGPYHHEGLHLPLEEAEPILRKSRASVEVHCRGALETLTSSFGIEGVVIQESPYEHLPDSLSEVLASRPLTYAADGMLYREELAKQAAALGLTVHRFPRKSDQIAAASEALACTEKEVGALLAGFGQAVGAPWRKEHKHVAAAALCVLAGELNR